MRKPLQLEIKDSDDSIELSSFIDPLLGLKLDADIYLSEVWNVRSKDKGKRFDEFRKLERVGKGHYASVFKVYHTPTMKIMV
jgi:hypothetical protein